MSQSVPQENRFPRIPLLGAGALIAFTLAVALLGRMTGIGAPEAVGHATAERSLRFEDRADGAVIVTGHVDRPAPRRAYR